MELIRYVLVNIIDTLVRFIPIPTRTGLLVIGNPGRDSPVLLTGNFRLTVERVKRALRGLDVYLLVADSVGINIWCASAGGYLTNHQVISAIKASGIEGLVNHRTVIVPQLAAVAIEPQVIRQKTGWKVIFGPVYAKDIPAFLARGCKKTPEMRQVNFDLVQRIEMAVMWAFPLSALGALITALIRPGAVLPLVTLIWGLSMGVFLAFPLYARWLNPKGHFPDFARGGFQVLFWGLSLLGIAGYTLLSGGFDRDTVFRWGLAALGLVLLLGFDMTGNTPVYKSSYHRERFFDVVLSEQRCIGCGVCVDVCPRNCFEVDEAARKARRPRAARCIQCGACLVQCPVDALFFRNPQGEVILPQIVRKYKLNMMGERVERGEK